MLTSTLPPNPKANKIGARRDSTVSKHYLTEENSDLLSNITAHTGPNVLLPNNTQICATKKGQLQLFEYLSENQKRELSYHSLQIHCLYLLDNYVIMIAWSF